MPTVRRRSPLPWRGVTSAACRRPWDVGRASEMPRTAAVEGGDQRGVAKSGRDSARARSSERSDLRGGDSAGRATLVGRDRLGSRAEGTRAEGTRGTFRRRARLAPVVARTLFFDQTVFDEEVQLNAAAGRLSCRGTRFGGRADLNVRWAEVALDEATFAGPRGSRALDRFRTSTKARLATSASTGTLTRRRGHGFFPCDRRMSRTWPLRTSTCAPAASSAPTASTSYASSPIATSPNLRRVGGTRAAALWPRSTTGTLAPPLRTLLRAPTPRPG